MHLLIPAVAQDCSSPSSIPVLPPSSTPAPSPGTPAPSPDTPAPSPGTPTPSLSTTSSPRPQPLPSEIELAPTSAAVAITASPPIQPGDKSAIVQPVYTSQQPPGVTSSTHTDSPDTSVTAKVAVLVTSHGGTTPSTPTPTESSDDETDPLMLIFVGAAAGACVIILVLLVLICVLVAIICMRRKKGSRRLRKQQKRQQIHPYEDIIAKDSEYKLSKSPSRTESSLPLSPLPCVPTTPASAPPISNGNFSLPSLMNPTYSGMIGTDSRKISLDETPSRDSHDYSEILDEESTPTGQPKHASSTSLTTRQVISPRYEQADPNDYSMLNREPRKTSNVDSVDHSMLTQKPRKTSCVGPVSRAVHRRKPRKFSVDAFRANSRPKKLKSANSTPTVLDDSDDYSVLSRTSEVTKSSPNVTRFAITDPEDYSKLDVSPKAAKSSPNVTRFAAHDPEDYSKLDRNTKVTKSSPNVTRFAAADPEDYSKLDQEPATPNGITKLTGRIDPYMVTEPMLDQSPGTERYSSLNRGTQYASLVPFQGGKPRLISLASFDELEDEDDDENYSHLSHVTA